MRRRIIETLDIDHMEKQIQQCAFDAKEFKVKALPVFISVVVKGVHYTYDIFVEVFGFRDRSTIPTLLSVT